MRMTTGRLVALVVATCLAAIVPGAPARARPATPVDVPAAVQSNLSPYPVLQRLGRWNGSTFEPVSARSIPPGPTIVMSHGWSPGYHDAYEELQAKTPTRWSPRGTRRW